MAARLKNKKKGRRARGDNLSYLQHRQSLAEYVGRVYDVVGWVEPFGRVLAQVCKLVQGRVGLDEDKQRGESREGAWNGWGKISQCAALVCVGVCARVSAKAGVWQKYKTKTKNTKTKSSLLKNKK